MGYSKLKARKTVDDYLVEEEAGPIRHEYVFGDIWAMAASTQNHSRIVGNLVSSIVRKLPDGECEVFFAAVKVRAGEDIFYYPDVLVTCEGNFSNRYYSEKPVLIVEVISPSTEKVDRREKLLAYRMMPSVQEIVLVDQRKVAIEIHKRQPNGGWLAFSYDDTDSEMTLDSVGFSIPLSDIYRRVNFTESSD